MNPVALVQNIRSSLAVCPSWRSRFSRLLWLYSNKWFVQAFSHTAYYSISFRYALPIGDLDILVRSNEGSDAFIFSEVFDHRYYDFALPTLPKTILDLGANIGLTAIFFARKYPEAELACVEPIPSNVKLLQSNLELNKVRANVFPSAIAVTDGTLQMELDVKDYGHKVAGILYGRALTGQLLEVEAMSVSTLLQKLNWQEIGLLKVDIEGYEAILLQENCEWLSCVNAICIECHEGYGESNLQALAERWGFSLPQQLPGGWLLIREEAKH